MNTSILVVAHPPRFTIRPDRKAFAELMYYGSGFTVSKVANYLALQLDNVIVGRWLGVVALGFYGRAYELMAAAPALLGEPVDKVLFPAMAARQGDMRSLSSAYRRGVAAMALVTLPLSAVLVVLAPEEIGRASCRGKSVDLGGRRIIKKKKEKGRVGNSCIFHLSCNRS